MVHYSYSTIQQNPEILDSFDATHKVKSVPIVCSICNGDFWREKHQIQTALKFHNKQGIFYCSKGCKIAFQKRSISTKCTNCQKDIVKLAADVKKSKTGNLFCSISCGTKFNNLNKSHGTTRSKLEIFIEHKIKSGYPNLECLFNSKKTIGSELDFYFPSLKLAIELNGIFHYEPIHGQGKLERIQQNDKNKYAACRDAGIEMIVVPSKLNHYKKKDQEAVWEGIKKIIDSKLATGRN